MALFPSPEFSIPVGTLDLDSSSRVAGPRRPVPTRPRVPHEVGSADSAPEDAGADRPFPWRPISAGPSRPTIAPVPHQQPSLVPAWSLPCHEELFDEESPPASLVMLPDGSIRIYTETVTCEQVRREYPNCLVGPTRGRGSQLTTDHSLKLGGTYYLTSCASSWIGTRSDRPRVPPWAPPRSRSQRVLDSPCSSDAEGSFSLRYTQSIVPRPDAWCDRAQSLGKERRVPRPPSTEADASLAALNLGGIELLDPQLGWHGLGSQAGGSLAKEEPQSPRLPAEASRKPGHCRRRSWWGESMGGSKPSFELQGQAVVAQGVQGDTPKDGPAAEASRKQARKAHRRMQSWSWWDRTTSEHYGLKTGDQSNAAQSQLAWEIANTTAQPVKGEEKPAAPQEKPSRAPRHRRRRSWWGGRKDAAPPGPSGPTVGIPCWSGSEDEQADREGRTEDQTTTPSPSRQRSAHTPSKSFGFGSSFLETHCCPVSPRPILGRNRQWSDQKQSGVSPGTTPGLVPRRCPSYHGLRRLESGSKGSFKERAMSDTESTVAGADAWDADQGETATMSCSPFSALFASDSAPQFAAPRMLRKSATEAWRHSAQAVLEPELSEEPSYLELGPSGAARATAAPVLLAPGASAAAAAAVPPAKHRRYASVSCLEDFKSQHLRPSLKTLRQLTNRRVNRTADVSGGPPEDGDVKKNPDSGQSTSAGVGFLNRIWSGRFQRSKYRTPPLPPSCSGKSAAGRAPGPPHGTPESTVPPMREQGMSVGRDHRRADVKELSGNPRSMGVPSVCEGLPPLANSQPTRPPAYWCSPPNAAARLESFSTGSHMGFKRAPVTTVYSQTLGSPVHSWHTNFAPAGTSKVQTLPWMQRTTSSCSDSSSLDLSSFSKGFPSFDPSVSSPSGLSYLSAPSPPNKNAGLICPCPLREPGL